MLFVYATSPGCDIYAPIILYFSRGPRRVRFVFSITFSIYFNAHTLFAIRCRHFRKTFWITRRHRNGHRYCTPSPFCTPSSKSDENSVHSDGTYHTNSIKPILLPAYSSYRIIWTKWIRRKVFHGKPCATCLAKWCTAAVSQTISINGYWSHSPMSGSTNRCSALILNFTRAIGCRCHVIYTHTSNTSTVYRPAIHPRCLACIRMRILRIKSIRPKVNFMPVLYNSGENRARARHERQTEIGWN